ncbi:MAG: dUTP diphosphatase [Peptococcaceae bacterium]|nr:dUTP diphosphatase [Peptococcaceae bacterium]
MRKIPTKNGFWPEPVYASEGAAGLDLCACIDEPLLLEPGKQVLVPTGIAIQMPDRTRAALIFPRSGLASKYGITMSNAVGLIDPDYTGEIKCPLINLGSEPFTVQPGYRIAQMVFVPIAIAKLTFTNQFKPTGRGSKGFGSTGI